MSICGNQSSGKDGRDRILGKSQYLQERSLLGPAENGYLPSVYPLSPQLSGVVNADEALVHGPPLLLTLQASHTPSVASTT